MPSGLGSRIHALAGARRCEGESQLDTHTEGTFRDGMTAEQTLLGMREACDMIRQRFELYEESVIL